MVNYSCHVWLTSGHLSSCEYHVGEEQFHLHVLASIVCPFRQGPPTHVALNDNAHTMLSAYVALDPDDNCFNIYANDRTVSTMFGPCWIVLHIWALSFKIFFGHEGHRIGLPCSSMKNVLWCTDKALGFFPQQEREKYSFPTNTPNFKIGY